MEGYRPTRPTQMGAVEMTQFLQLTIYGVQLGTTYALIALGYTLVYGVIQLINFAHGDLIMIGAYVAYFAFNLAHMGFVPAVISAMLVTAAIGVAIERVAYKPLRYRPRLSALITAMGVSIFIENFARVLPFIGSNFRPFPKFITVRNFAVGGININTLQIVDFIVTTGLMVVIWVILYRTKIGKAMRAVAADKEVVQLMGINIDTVISVTFALGAAFAAVAGVLYSLTYPSLDPYMGGFIGLKAFVGAVLGGIGSVQGAVVGGIVMGLAEAYASAIYSELGYGIGFLLLVVILLVKPAGLFGKFTVEKV